ncbi:MAG: molybdopterin-dependent oxidoreductase, partial [Stenotrophomonas maltophilia]
WSTGFGELRDAETGSGRGTFVQIDSRFSMTAANADRWLPIKPGMEGHLALSLAHVIVQEKLQADDVDLKALTGGQEAEFLADFSPETVAPNLWGTEAMLNAETIRELARDFASHRPSLAIGGDSAGAQENGLFNLEAIYALNYLVGSVGVPGGLRFNPRSPLTDWPQPSVAASIPQWRQVVSAINEGKTKLLMVHQADPVYGLPQAVGLEGAIKGADVFTVSFSPFLDETSALADLILPDRVYLEDWGADSPNPGPGYQVVGIQQPVVNPLGTLDPRSFGDILLSTAQELREDADLPWNSLREALEQTSNTLFALDRGSIDADSEKEFWTKLLRQGGWWDEQNTGPAVNPADGLYSQIAKEASEPAALSPGEFYLIPFAHNTLLDGRNTHLPWAQSAPDPITTVTWQTWVEVNARLASEKGWREGDVIRIEANGSFIQALLYPNPALPPDVVAVPVGQGRRNGPGYAVSGEERESSNILGILDAALVNETGALAWAGNRVRLEPTGESLRVSKFEGEFGAREIGNVIINNPGEEIIKTVAPGGH